MPIVKKLRGATKPGKPKASAPSHETGIELPTKFNTPPKSLFGYTLTFFGEKGVGKSSLASQFPNAIDFMFEPGRKNLPILQIPDPNKSEKPLNWERFLGYVDLVKKSKFQTIIIDTIDRAYECCFNWVCANRGITHPHQLNDYGETWNAISEEFDRTLTSLIYANKQLILISHAKLREVGKKVGIVYDQVVPTCTERAWLFIRQVGDVSFYYGYNGQHRTLRLRGNSDAIWTSCGLTDYFLDPEGNPIQEFVVPDSPKKAYETLLDAFANKVYGVPPEDDAEPEGEEKASDLSLEEASSKTRSSFTRFKKGK